MPPPSHILVEIVVFAMGIATFVIALRTQKLNAALLVPAALVYSCAFEIVCVARGSHHYGPFFVGVHILGCYVPFWVPVGWGVLVYGGTHAANKLGINGVSQAFYAALLALSVDVALDPMAVHEGMWGFRHPNHVGAFPYYDVSWANLYGWIVIVTSFAYFAGLAYDHKIKPETPHGTALLWLGGVVLAAFVTTVVVHSLLDLAATSLGGGAVFSLVLLFSVAMGLRQLGAGVRSRDDTPFLIAIPLVFHATIFAAFLVSGSLKDMATIAVVMPSLALLGVIGYGWTHFNRVLHYLGGPLPTDHLSDPTTPSTGASLPGGASPVRYASEGPVIVHNGQRYALSQGKTHWYRLGSMDHPRTP